MDAASLNAIEILKVLLSKEDPMELQGYELILLNVKKVIEK